MVERLQTVSRDDDGLQEHEDEGQHLWQYQPRRVRERRRADPSPSDDSSNSDESSRDGDRRRGGGNRDARSSSGDSSSSDSSSSSESDNEPSIVNGVNGVAEAGGMINKTNLSGDTGDGAHVGSV
ncbi:hypothetical protein PI124_g3698 [Phytophthora idaei]|nr:hypothetical protein PI124_g3698 [Phytophthora idaei]